MILYIGVSDGLDRCTQSLTEVKVYYIEEHTTPAAIYSEDIKLVYNAPNKAPHFSQEAVDILADEFSISGSQKQDLNFMLEQGARMYFSAKEFGENSDRPANTRATLNKLMRRSNALRETLEELPYEVARKFEEITLNDSLKILEKGGRKFHDQPTLTLETLDTFPGDSIPIVEIQDMIQLVDAIARLSAETKELLPNAKFGRPTDQALDLWIANLAHFWSKHLNKKFTRDDLGGGIPISPAAEFCSRASEYLDRDIPGTLIMKSMKKYIKSNK